MSKPHVYDMTDIKCAVMELEKNERNCVCMLLDGAHRSEIVAALHMNPVQVSRIEKKAYHNLKNILK